MRRVPSNPARRGAAPAAALVLPALLLALLLALLATSRATPARADPSRDVLWVAVKTCLLAHRTTGGSFPCLAVDPGEGTAPGTAVLRAPGQRTHTVLMPTDTVSGLEAPVLRGPRGIAYWRAALAARRFVAEAAGAPLTAAAVGLAVNSEGGRSQDQLHIHLDCVRPSVAAALARSARAVHGTSSHGTSSHGTWTRVPGLPGGRYLALRVPEAEAETFNPFAALAHLPGRPDLSETSFAALATPPGDPRPGFLLLAYTSPIAHAEELLDHACRAARAGGRRG